MRSIFHTTVPGLRSRLYRPPETDDERYEIQAHGVPLYSAVRGDWTWKEVEVQLRKAYKGGITAWAQTALGELGVERTKRDREQEA